MNQNYKAVGILGGTFDPIHHGHLRMALELYETLNLNAIHLIPTFQPAYRPLPIATAQQRLAMIRCAIAEEPALIADEREIRRPGPTYTIDTLIELRKEMPEISLCLLIGIDAFLGLPTWHRWREILDYAHVIVAHRPCYYLPETGPLAELITAHSQEIPFIHQQLSGGILLCPITSLEISATVIRKQIAVGRNPRYLLPDKVYDFIKTHQTYRIG
jgi:nicotinate-nucleotide adenylyltransferase